MKVGQFTCPYCDEQFDFAEKIGTTSAYVDYCPSCGANVGHGCYEHTDV